MRLARLQQRIPERQVGLVPQRGKLFVPGVDIAELFEDLLRFLHTATAHQGDTEIELRVARPLRIAFPVLQQRNRAIEIAAVDQQLRLQHRCLALDVLWQVVADVVERSLRLIEVPALAPDLREKEPGPVANFRIDVVRQQALEYIRRLEVMSVGEVQATLEQLRLRRMLLQLLLLLCGQQANDGREVVLLVEVEKHLAVMRFLYDDRRRLVLARERRRCRRQERQDQETTDEDGVASDQ